MALASDRLGPSTITTLPSDKVVERSVAMESPVIAKSPDPATMAPTSPRAPMVIVRAGLTPLSPPGSGSDEVGWAHAVRATAHTVQPKAGNRRIASSILYVSIVVKLGECGDSQEPTYQAFVDSSARTRVDTMYRLSLLQSSSLPLENSRFDGLRILSVNVVSPEIVLVGEPVRCQVAVRAIPTPGWRSRRCCQYQRGPWPARRRLAGGRSQWPSAREQPTGPGL
jgi:hypothetical protein